MLSGLFAVLLVGTLAGLVGNKSGRDCSCTPCDRSYSRDYYGDAGGARGTAGAVAIAVRLLW